MESASCRRSFSAVELLAAYPWADCQCQYRVQQKNRRTCRRRASSLGDAGDRSGCPFDLSLERSPLSEQIRVLTCSSQLERVVERSSRISWTDGRACSGFIGSFLHKLSGDESRSHFFRGKRSPLRVFVLSNLSIYHFSGGDWWDVA